MKETVIIIELKGASPKHNTNLILVANKAEMQGSYFLIDGKTLRNHADHNGYSDFDIGDWKIIKGKVIDIR